MLNPSGQAFQDAAEELAKTLRQDRDAGTYSAEAIESVLIFLLLFIAIPQGFEPQAQHHDVVGRFAERIGADNLEQVRQYFKTNPPEKKLILRLSQTAQEILANPENQNLQKASLWLSGLPKNTPGDDTANTGVSLLELLARGK